MKAKARDTALKTTITTQQYDLNEKPETENSQKPTDSHKKLHSQ